MSPEPDDRSVQCLLSEKEGPEEHSAARSPSLVICIFCASIGLAATDHGMASAVIGPWEFLHACADERSAKDPWDNAGSDLKEINPRVTSVSLWMR